MRKTLLLAAAFAISVPAWAFHCPEDMKAIDAKLATNPKMAEADMKKVKALRAKGEEEHKAGKHNDSVKTLAEAKKMLGI